MNVEDWRLLFEEWDLVPPEYRMKIEALFREKPKEKLAELFEREPYALRLYEKIVEKWVPPAPQFGLGSEEKAKLEDAYRRIFIEAGADWRGTLPAMRDEITVLEEELKTTPRPEAFKAARMRIEDLARSLLPPPKPPTPPLPAIPAVLTLPEPRAMTYICPIDGASFISADPETMYYVRGALRWFPREYFEYCPECQSKLMGWPPLESIIQEGFEAGLLPPVWARWLLHVAETIKSAKGVRH
ncbi:MAG: hypothetical protein QXO01_07335 [Nitrososphaerota archaeon]